MWSYVIFRYQPDLLRDDWAPLGVVVERSCDNGGAEIGVMCLSQAEVEGCSEIATAMLQGADAVLRNEVESTRARMGGTEDFLEALRAGSPWNFHFTPVASCNLDTDDIRQAAMILFYKHVILSQQTALPPTIAIKPRRMEGYELAV
ncbi:MAG TPA: hypothetical protein VMV10_08190 [Pirellulales bacterium]|nr:hypothetical protein [Pirellulales bacterium]